MGYSRKEREPKWFQTDVITITSETGVGSTALFNELKEKFYSDPRKQFASAGEIFRAHAQFYGMDIETFSKYVTAHPEKRLDQLCDGEMMRRGQKNHTFLEGRLAHFVPGYHVLLTCEIEERARRRQKQENYSHLSVDEIVSLIVERDATNKKRYDALYPGWQWPESDYDKIIPTDKGLTIPGEVRELVEGHESWFKKMALVGRIIYCT